MKFVKIGLLVIGLILAGLIIVAPIGPLPGIFIGGTESDVPENWPDTSTTHEVKLKVQGTIPRVVTIWFVQVNGDLHVVGAKTSGWVKMLGEGGPVLLRLGDQVFSLKATRLTTGFEPVMQAYKEKYINDYPDIINGLPPMEEAAQSASVFRLQR